MSFFIRFGEMKRNITCSIMDPLQWMGAVKMRVQTADKTITSHPHIFIPIINVLWSDKLHVCKTQIHRYGAFKVKLLLSSKIQIHDNASSSEKIIWSESGEKSAQINYRLQIITTHQIWGWVLMWEDKEIDFFSLKEALFWRFLLN